MILPLLSKPLKRGSKVTSKEENTALAIRQEKFIRDLKNALIRIENKTYGICRVTGKLIDKRNYEIGRASCRERV